MHLGWRRSQGLMVGLGSDLPRANREEEEIVRHLALILSILCFVTGCGPAPDDTGEERPEPKTINASLLGTWQTNFDTQESITVDRWGDNEIHSYDNGSNLVITRVPDDGEWSPGTYSKIVYTDIVDDRFFYCIVTYDKATADDALADETTADATDPLNSGCGGFSWTQMTRE